MAAPRCTPCLAAWFIGLALAGVTPLSASAQPAPAAQPDRAAPPPGVILDPQNGRQALPELGFTQAARDHDPQTQPPLPRGAGIALGHVEGSAAAYGPNRAAPEFRGLIFHYPASPPGQHTAHANRVGRMFYGRFGVAARASDIHVYPANAWLGAAYLNAGTPDPPVDDSPVRVFNHSWIADPNEAAAVNALQRIDFVADVYDTLIVAGVNNGRNTRVPFLCASAHNALAVGTHANGGASSGGYTRIDTPGRCKPDLVAPRGLSSWATPVVAGVAACLLERADAIAVEHPAAPRTETIRAVLAAGCAKPPAWQPETGKPLDEPLGAGVVRYDRSLTILDAPHTPGDTTARPGWMAGTLDRAASHAVTLTLDTSAELCVSLHWNRRVQGLNVRFADRPGQPAVWVPRDALCNLDLSVERQDEAGAWQPFDASSSTIDNVEHVYRRAAPAGTYRVTVTYTDTPLRQPDDEGLPRLDEATPWDYTLAWWVGPALP